MNHDLSWAFDNIIIPAEVQEQYLLQILMGQKQRILFHFGKDHVHFAVENEIHRLSRGVPTCYVRGNHCYKIDLTQGTYVTIPEIPEIVRHNPSTSEYVYFRTWAIRKEEDPHHVVQ